MQEYCGVCGKHLLCCPWLHLLPSVPRQTSSCASAPACQLHQAICHMQYMARSCQHVQHSCQCCLRLSAMSASLHFRDCDFCFMGTARSPVSNCRAFVCIVCIVTRGNQLYSIGTGYNTASLLREGCKKSALDTTECTVV